MTSEGQEVATTALEPAEKKLKKSPSARISRLVSQFEPPTSSLAYPANSDGRNNPSLQPPTKPATLARSWSKLGGGRVEKNVRRFSTDALATETGENEKLKGTAGRRRPSVESLDYVSGSIGGMDWKPRSELSASNLEIPAAPKPPPPAARFRHTHLPRPAPRFVPPIPTSSSTAQKSPPADTIIVPASVESSSADGRTKIVIASRNEEVEASRKKMEEPDRSGGSRENLEKQTEDSRPNLLSLSADPTSHTPHYPHSFNTFSSATPSFAISEATVVGGSVYSRPSLGDYKPSLTSAESVDAFRDPVSSTKDSAKSTVLESLTSSHESVLFPPSLDLPESPPPPPCRPKLSRAGTSLRTTSTLAVHSYPAHEVFSRNAAPLHLPDLDKLLETLGGAPEFSLPPVDLTISEGNEIELERRERKKAVGDNGVGSKEEKKSWNEWVRGKPPNLWKRLMTSLDKLENDKERLMEGERPDLTKEQRLRSLIFPPFHRLPPNATLTDLKSNIRKPPPLFSGNAILQTAADGALNIFGSAAGIRLTTIEGLRDLMQMITLLSTSASPSLSLLTVSAPSTPHSVAESSTFRTIFITVPSALSLDFASAFGQALLFLIVFTLLAILALYEFYRFTGGWKGPSSTATEGGGGGSDIDLGEGYDREDLHVRKTKLRDRKGWKILITFFLTTIYLPLSKLSISALFWERGYWPSELFGTDSKNDRCFTTLPSGGGGGKGFNSAIIIIPIALLVLTLLSFWFPMRMYRVVQGTKPTVDKWTELGELRRDKKGEYERLLDKDPSPFSFLYREYRSEWSTFRSIYMVVKLFNVFIIVLISTDNCVFLNFDETRIDIIRQGTLFGFMTCFFLLDVYSRPQLDEISNRSDRISRMAYVLISLCGLLVALSVPGKTFFDGSAIVIINAFSYSFNVYFTLIGTQILRRFIKRVQKRLDFSIDVFSPQLDLSKHISRRIWQETFSTLFFTAPEFEMKPETNLKYCGYPPYLLNFKGTVAERHSENLKILREIGLDAYYDAMSFPQPQIESKGESHSRLKQVRKILENRIAGPDVFYQPDSNNLSSPSSSITTFFGRLDIVPFPFVVIFRYDQDPSTPFRLASLEEFELVIQQQELPHVKSARKVRLVLRALEDQLIYSPRIETRRLQEKEKSLEISQTVSYEFCAVKIKRNSSFFWQGYNYSSGFEVTFEWKGGKGIGIGKNGKLSTDFELTLPGNQCGMIHSDFSLTLPLATLFKNNRHIIEQRLPLIEEAIVRHRNYFAKEFESKRQTLSYDFLFTIFAENTLSIEELDSNLGKVEKNEKVKNLIKNHSTSFNCLQERMKLVTSSKVRTWWYILFDDLFRRNRQVFKDKVEDFSPHYSSSICYLPMPRAQLEQFLNERGFPTNTNSSSSRTYFSRGFLNQIYFVLDEIAFSSTNESIPIHLSSQQQQQQQKQKEHAFSEPIHYSSLPRKLLSPTRRVLEEGVDHTVGSSSRLTTGTGDGTNEDERDIKPRREFLFETVFNRKRSKPLKFFVKGQRCRWFEFLFKIRLKKGIERWLGWNLNELDNHSDRVIEEEILLDLRKDRDGRFAL
ncbi:hypothetical protein JCM5350_000303 [Sporobolomyces pararoseus]